MEGENNRTKQRTKNPTHLLPKQKTNTLQPPHLLRIFLLCAKSYPKYFTYIISFYPNYSSMRKEFSIMFLCQKKKLSHREFKWLAPTTVGHWTSPAGSVARLWTHDARVQVLGFLKVENYCWSERSSLCSSHPEPTSLLGSYGQRESLVRLLVVKMYNKSSPNLNIQAHREMIPSCSKGRSCSHLVGGLSSETNASQV